MTKRVKTVYILPRVLDLLALLRGGFMKFDLWVVNIETGETSRIYCNLSRKKSQFFWQRWASEYSKGNSRLVPMLWPRNRDFPCNGIIAFSCDTLV